VRSIEEAALRGPNTQSPSQPRPAPVITFDIGSNWSAVNPTSRRACACRAGEMSSRGGRSIGIGTVKRSPSGPKRRPDA